MQLNKYTFIIWLGSSLLLIALLPVSNMIAHNKIIALNDTEQLFNTDGLEAYINYALYQLGISAHHQDTIVGKEGWLFLGDNYDKSLLNTRSILNTNMLARIEQSTHTIKARQDWLATHNIPMYFVLVPNKYSVYQDKHPNWLTLPNTTYADQFVKKAKEKGIHLLDLRPKMRDYRSIMNEALYYKFDSHWTFLGASLAYQSLMSELNKTLNINLAMVNTIHHESYSSLGGDLSKFLKIKDRFESIIEVDYIINFDGKDDKICLKELQNENLLSKNPCHRVNNKHTGFMSQAIMTSNDQALNNISILWLRDSFGMPSSRLMQATFQTIWAFHHGVLIQDSFKNFILNKKPQGVIMQVIERELDAEHFQ